MLIQETKEGLERQFGINHIGHFLLTTSLLDLMGEGSRIVVVASVAHKTGKIHFDDINLHRGFNVIKPFFQTPEQGARTAVFLATDDSVADVSGEYFYKCKIAKSSKRSKDMELAKELFEFSSKLINNKA